MVREPRESAMVLAVTDETHTPGLTLELVSTLSCSHPSVRGTEEQQVASICIKSWRKWAMRSLLSFTVKFSHLQIKFISVFFLV